MQRPTPNVNVQRQRSASLLLLRQEPTELRGVLDRLPAVTKFLAKCNCGGSTPFFCSHSGSLVENAGCSSVFVFFSV